MARIQLIFGYQVSYGGLKVDGELTAEILRNAGHEVVVTGYSPLRSSPSHSDLAAQFDMNLFFEHCGPQGFLDLHLKEAKWNVAIPNPDWFNPEWLRCLRHFDAVFCKTHETKRLFERVGAKRVIYTSFTSPDRYQPTATKSHDCFHAAGGSALKGTSSLLELWRRHGASLPVLQLHLNEKLVTDGVISLEPVANVHFHAGCIDAQQWLRTQNHFQFHLCPSRSEGFGHYIHEAKSTGAIVLTIDAPPMNEFIDPSFGLLVPYRRALPWGFSTGYEPCLDGLYQAVAHRMQELCRTPNRLAEMSARTREDFLAKDRLFRDQFPNIVADLLAQ